MTSPKHEIVFEATEAEEGGLCARALGHSIFTQGSNWDDLMVMVRDAVDCHFDDDRERPSVIRIRGTNRTVVFDDPVEIDHKWEPLSDGWNLISQMKLEDGRILGPLPGRISLSYEEEDQLKMHDESDARLELERVSEGHLRMEKRRWLT